MSFSNTTFGKCIFAGEHAVLRGVPAVVYPVKSKSLTLNYNPMDKDLDVEFSGETGESFRLLFSGVVDMAQKKLGLSRDQLRGQCFIDGNLPVGTGLGASAALCVNVGRLFHHLGWVKSDELYEFCRSLEDLFHGESSGVDIAAAIEKQGICFQRGGEWKPLNQTWTPNLYISYSGQVGATSECVQKVKRLFETDEFLAKELDQQMGTAVEMIIGALEEDAPRGLPHLGEGINLALTCFEKWGLTQGSLGVHLDELKRSGAVAVKPTGSGNGGFVLSLWDGTPTDDHIEKFQLTPIF